MNQKDVADVIRADQPKVSKILNGKYTSFRLSGLLSTFQKLGYGIHVTPFRVRKNDDRDCSHGQTLISGSLVGMPNSKTIAQGAIRSRNLQPASEKARAMFSKTLALAMLRSKRKAKKC